MPATASYNSDHYVQRLDLGADPFAEDFESDYFYSGAQRRQILDQLVHFGRFSDQVVMLVGATGSGTSWLVDRDYAQLAEVMDCCFVDAESAMSDQQLMSVLNEQLQLDLAEPIMAGEFMAAVQSIAYIDGEPEPILVVVDQAHYLSLESYVLLRDLVLQGADFIRLMLVGEYQVENLALLAQFDKQTIKRLELEPLTQEEIGAYLLGLLQSVGYAGDQPLGNDQLAVLYEQTGGNLAEVTQLLPTLLSADDEEPKAGLRRAIPLTHIAVIGLLVVVLVAGWLYQSPMSSLDSPSVTTTEKELDEKINTSKANTSNGAIDRIPTSVEPKAIATIQRLNEVVSEDAGKIAEDKAQANTAPDQKEGPELPVSGVAKSSPAETSPQAEVDVEQEVPAPEPSATVAVTKPVFPDVQPAPVKPKVAAVESANVKPKPAAKDKKVAAVTKTVKQPKSDVKTQAPAVKASPQIPSREQRLLDVPSDNYVLQLMGSVDEARARSFVKKYVGRLPISYFEAELKGKPWFVAVVGPYDNKQAALAGIKVLPAELQKLRPWARSIEGIQADIRAHHR